MVLGMSPLRAVSGHRGFAVRPPYFRDSEFLNRSYEANCTRPLAGEFMPCGVPQHDESSLPS